MNKVLTFVMTDCGVPTISVEVDADQAADIIAGWRSGQMSVLNVVATTGQVIALDASYVAGAVCSEATTAETPVVPEDNQLGTPEVRRSVRGRADGPRLH